jgi:Tfp pilus assembly protein PilN
MINLLPPEVKAQYRYASYNTRVRGWLIAVCLVLLGMAAISGAGLLYLRQISHSYDQQIADSTASLKRQKIDQTRKEVNDISSSLKLSVQVLSKEVLFSQLLRQLATLTPANTSLSSLNISQDQTALDIVANTADYNAATQLQVNLSDPNNKIFSKADIVTISCGGNDAPSSTPSKYPCSVTIRALLAKDNPFLFINSKKTAS